MMTFVNVTIDQWEGSPGTCAAWRCRWVGVYSAYRTYIRMCCDSDDAGGAAV